MGWVRVDDSFYDHPKHVKAGPVGQALWLAGLAWANRNRQDGFIPAGVAHRLIDCDGLVAEVASHLIDCGLWEEADGGYVIHDYLEYQFSVEERDRRHAQKVAAGRAGGVAAAIARAQAAATASAQAESKPKPKPKPKPSGSDEPEKPERRRAPNPSFDALAEVWPSQTRAERTRIAKALSELAGADDVTPANLRARSKRLLERARRDNWQAPTVMALPTHWSELATNGRNPHGARPCPTHGTSEACVETPVGWNHQSKAGSPL